MPTEAPTTPPNIQRTQSAGDALLGMPNAAATKGTAGKSVTLDVKFALTRRPGRNVVAALPGTDSKL